MSSRARILPCRPAHPRIRLQVFICRLNHRHLGCHLSVLPFFLLPPPSRFLPSDRRLLELMAFSRPSSDRSECHFQGNRRRPAYCLSPLRPPFCCRLPEVNAR